MSDLRIQGGSEGRGDQTALLLTANRRLGCVKRREFTQPLLLRDTHGTGRERRTMHVHPLAVRCGRCRRAGGRSGRDEEFIASHSAHTEQEERQRERERR